jgi:hypothetical protein
MLGFDDEKTRNLVGDIDQIELVMLHIPTKELYGLQTSVMQEVQSIAHADDTNLEVGREVAEVLQITWDQLTMDKEEEKRCTNKLEKGMTEVYNNIPYCAKEPKDKP